MVGDNVGAEVVGDKVGDAVVGDDVTTRSQTQTSSVPLSTPHTLASVLALKYWHREPEPPSLYRPTHAIPASAHNVLQLMVDGATSVNHAQVHTPLASHSSWQTTSTLPNDTRPHADAGVGDDVVGDRVGVVVVGAAVGDVVVGDAVGDEVVGDDVVGDAVGVAVVGDAVGVVVVGDVVGVEVVGDDVVGNAVGVDVVGDMVGAVVVGDAVGGDVSGTARSQVHTSSVPLTASQALAPELALKN